VKPRQAKAGALVFLASFVYGFWRVGNYLPGVPEAGRFGLFHLQQVQLIDG
jgi:hypothetical protein